MIMASAKIIAADAGLQKCRELLDCQPSLPQYPAKSALRYFATSMYGHRHGTSLRMDQPVMATPYPGLLVADLLQRLDDDNA